MVRLNKFQTYALKRLFKKVDIDTISFEDSIDDGVMIRATDEYGWEAAIDMDRYGRLITFIKNLPESMSNEDQSV